MPLIIYVVYHNVREDLNVFTLTLQEAKAKRIELSQQNDEYDISDWSIRKFTEGQVFSADFNDFFTNDSTSCDL